MIRQMTIQQEKVRESPFINATDNLSFQIILSSLHESCVFITITYEILSFIDLFLLDSEIFLIWIIKKMFYIKFNRDYWQVYLVL